MATRHDKLLLSGTHVLHGNGAAPACLYPQLIPMMNRYEVCKYENVFSSSLKRS